MKEIIDFFFNNPEIQNVSNYKVDSHWAPYQSPWFFEALRQEGYVGDDFMSHMRLGKQFPEYAWARIDQVQGAKACLDAVPTPGVGARGYLQDLQPHEIEALKPKRRFPCIRQ